MQINHTTRALALGVGLLAVAGCAIESKDEVEQTADATVVPSEPMPHEVDAEMVQTHDELMDQIVGTPSVEIGSVGILVYEGVNDLDVMGPRYVLGQLMGSQTRLIGVEPGSIRTVMGTELVPDAVIDDVDQLDILVVPGGFRGTIEAAYDDRILEWIRDIDETSTYTAAVCTGTWVLGATGLLEGRKVSSNWYRAAEKMAQYGAEYTGERFTVDGKYWTSAGVTAGMDMSLAIMNEIWGEQYTQGVMLDMEYDPAPPITGGTPELSDPAVFEMMQAMYDMGVVPIVDSLEAVKAGGS